MEFIQTEGNQFFLNGEKIILRGWALGSWMNVEHFMIGLPGTNSMILEAFEEIYGKERAKQWLDSMLSNMVGEKDIRYLKSIGINSIRIPFGYHYLMDDAEPEVLREEGLRHLDRVIKLCAENELYVILDLHSVPGAQNTDWHSDNGTGQALFWEYRCFQDQVIWLWEKLASRYADNPWIIGYDVINEPHYKLSGEQINGFYRRLIAAIRKQDKNHILFLEGIDFGRNFAPLEDYEDPQIAYTVHFYPFVLQEDVLNPQMDEERRIYIFREIFEKQIKDVTRFGRPIWCGESGYEIMDGMEPFYAKLLLHNISICEEREISWNLWTYKDAGRMGIVVPQNDSDWMSLRRRIAEQWSHEWEQKTSMEIVHYIGDTYYHPIENSLAYDLDFRIRSILHRIAVEQILKPILKEIPWEKMKMYPEDFSFDRCRKREVIVEAIKKEIQGRV